MDNCLVVCSQALEGIPGHLAEVVMDAYGIAVDGGLAHFKVLPLKPAVWVGDGDSVKKADLQKLRCKKLKLSRTKDYTDLEYALHVAGRAFLEGEWEGNLILIGAQGGRIDHELASWLAVQRWLVELAQAIGAENCPSAVSYGPHGMWLATMTEATFRQPKGQLFSVMAFDRAIKLTISGARYNLKNKLLAHASMGLSNEGMGKQVTVKVSQDSATPVFLIFPGH